jgi:hypothetical protein
VQTLDEVEAMVFTLKRNSKIARATHNMLAYRIATQKAGTFLQDYDDDGETAAGRRMLHLLQVCAPEYLAAQFDPLQFRAPWVYMAAWPRLLRVYTTIVCTAYVQIVVMTSNTLTTLFGRTRSILCVINRHLYEL